MHKDAYMHKIVVVGSINNDLVINSPRLPGKGETVFGSGFMTAAGGKGANQAVAAARLGAEVTMVGAVGGDIFGADLTLNLERNGVDIRYVKVHSQASSGTAVIILHQGDNCIVVDPGANNLLTSLDIDEAEAAIGSADMMIIQLEIPQETVLHAMEIAKRAGVRVLLNPAPASETSDNILALADILTPNESECLMLSGINPMENPEGAIRFFMDKGVSQVCITMGEHGVVFNVGEEIKNIPCCKVDCVVDTTAAGDSFTAGLAVALCEGCDIEEAVTFANTVASITVTGKGAQPSLPYRDAVIAKM